MMCGFPSNKSHLAVDMKVLLIDDVGEDTNVLKMAAIGLLESPWDSGIKPVYVVVTFLRCLIAYHLLATVWSRGPGRWNHSRRARGLKGRSPVQRRAFGGSLLYQLSPRVQNPSTPLLHPHKLYFLLNWNNGLTCEWYHNADETFVRTKSIHELGVHESNYMGC
jgi:hypothetical protein